LTSEKKEVASLRVLHVIDHFYPRLGYQETFLAKEHQKENTVLVICSNNFEKSIYRPNRELYQTGKVAPGQRIEEGVPTRRLLGILDGFPFHKPWLFSLEKTILDFDPDVIIVHDFVSLSTLRIAKLATKLPRTRMIFDDHMTYDAFRGSWVLSLHRLFGVIFSKLVMRPNFVFVAVTPQTFEIMTRIYRLRASRIRLIPLGVDSHRFDRVEHARDNLRRDLGIGVDDVVFIYVGKIVPYKGIDILISAELKLHERHANTKFIFVGGADKAYLRNLKNTISCARLEKSFVFTGVVPNSSLQAYYSIADVGVWPSQCSLSMLEATACGLPTVISARGGAPERVSWGNGLMYNEPDYIDLAARLEKLMDRELRLQMSERALSYAATIGWNRIAAMFLDLDSKGNLAADFRMNVERRNPPAATRRA
jgi:glycosyltransferase involved in cell wall biosynthesis